MSELELSTEAAGLDVLYWVICVTFSYVEEYAFTGMAVFWGE